jgi:hypothetical protein
MAERFIIKHKNKWHSYKYPIYADDPIPVACGCCFARYLIKYHVPTTYWGTEAQDGDK